MTCNRRPALSALTAAGLLWGTTVPLSKAALTWLPPAWLTTARFGLAAAVLLVAARSRLRSACTPAVLAAGALGYGGSVLVQNAGLTRTSVSHAALLVGAAPVLIAIIAACWHRAVTRPLAWTGFLISLAGVGLVVGGGTAGTTVGGDGLVLAAVLISATFTVAQARLLPGRDPVAVTAVQFLAASLAVLPVALATEGQAAPGGPAVLLATIGLVLGGTLLPFTLFAYGQARVPAALAGAFLNLEPLVGALAGVVFFGNPAGLPQLAGGLAILAGITLSSLPLLAARRRAADSQSAADPPSAAGPQRVARLPLATGPEPTAHPRLIAGEAAGRPAGPRRPGLAAPAPGCPSPGRYGGEHVRRWRGGLVQPALLQMPGRRRAAGRRRGTGAAGAVPGRSAARGRDHAGARAARRDRPARADADHRTPVR